MTGPRHGTGWGGQRTCAVYARKAVWGHITEGHRCQTEEVGFSSKPMGAIKVCLGNLICSGYSEAARGLGLMNGMRRAGREDIPKVECLGIWDQR